LARLYLELEAISPLAIRSDHAPGGSGTTRFISGTTLLGGLATAHRLLYPSKTEEFAKLFLNEQVHYPNLYPASFTDSEMQNSDFPVYPVPKTAQSCKRHKGFLSQVKKDGEEGHGVHDELLDWAMFKLASNDTSDMSVSKQLQAFEKYKSCLLCGAAMDRFDGYYRRNQQNIMTAELDTHLQTRTGINRDWDTVEENILYNREVIEDHMLFGGVVNLPDELVSPFKDFITEVGEEDLMPVGTGRTRGLGQVHIGIGKVEEEDGSEFSAFKKRISEFNDALHAQAEEMAIGNAGPFYFALTLHSPLILQDHLMRYRGTINGETLTRFTGFSSSSLTIERLYQAASIRRVIGWSELWGTPRSQEYAIETGSVFLFSASRPLEDGELESLFKLEKSGLGQRRSEGFGRLLVSDPFHLEGELC
jgi:CRISPR-associated protein Csx10